MPLVKVFIMKKGSASKIKIQEKRLNIEFGILIDLSWELPLLEELKIFILDQEAKFFILEVIITKFIIRKFIRFK
jgi:hypothetical protein